MYKSNLNYFHNAFENDAMGNINRQLRYSRNGTLIDNLTYNYQTNNGRLLRNRLYHLNDSQTNSSAFTDDIDDMGTFTSSASTINSSNNYSYDEEGRLIKDNQEGISKIVWRVDGKVKEVQRTSGGTTKWLRFDYERKHCFRRRSALADKLNSAGEMGHRIAKHVYANNGSTLEKSTYYVLDAQGNQLSMYEYFVSGGTAQYNLAERNIYGSSRLGAKQDDFNMLTASVNPYKYTRTLGWKYYEFTNHLGNVLTVYSDIKIPKDADNNNVVDGFSVCVRNITDYSPFGVSLDGRTIQTDFYRRGFNGMELDDEIKGKGNSYDFGARMYDSRVGRWLTLDPLMPKFPWQSPYCAFDDNPLFFVDKDGNESIKNNPDPIPSFIYSHYKFNTLTKKWNNGWHMQNSFDFIIKMYQVANYSLKMASKIKKELNLSDYHGKNDIEWLMNFGSEAPQEGFVLNLNYNTSKGNKVKLSFFTFDYSNEYGDGKNLNSISIETIKSNYSNCYSHALGMYGYINTTEDFKTILRDDYLPVKDLSEVKEGTIAFSANSEHAMKVVKKDGDKLIYESTWNGYGENLQGTFDELKEKMFNYLNPTMKEGEFIFYNKKK